MGARDRFSTLAGCLRVLRERTPEPHDLIVVVGGAPEARRRAWLDEFGDGVRWIFRPEFLNQAQSRNIGLREVRTRLAVTMDDDVMVRPGWLSALLRCQAETGAVMVVPLILEADRRIHTAGNDLYVTHEDGRAYAHKELRFFGMTYGERANLERRRTDYGELHCQLVEVEATLALGAYDEQILEVGEVDSGLVWARAGREMWFEPTAVVQFSYGTPLEAEDIRFFEWRWDMRAVLEGYRHFERKWNMDMTEHGHFRDFLWYYNRQLGLLPRLFPSRWALRVDDGLRRLRWGAGRLAAPLLLPAALARRYKARRLGFDSWPPPTHG